FVFAVVIRYNFEQRQHAEQLVTQLEEAQERLQVYANEVEELAVTRERNRMAREIHDTLGHYLTLLAVQLETATKLQEHGDPRLRDELAVARTCSRGRAPSGAGPAPRRSNCQLINCGAGAPGRRAGGHSA